MLDKLKAEILRVQRLLEKKAVAFEGIMAQALINHRLIQAQAAIVSESENAMRVSYEELKQIKG